MSPWRVRTLDEDDLDQVVRIWEESRDTTADPAVSLAEVVSALQADMPAVVAVVGKEVVGAAVSSVAQERGWVLRLAIARQWRRHGIGSALLAALEERLARVGVRRIGALLPEGEVGEDAFRNSGYTGRPDLSYFEKLLTADSAEATVLDQLDGAVPEDGLWERIAGMTAEKTLIERRLVLPLENPEVAGLYQLVPPRAVVLFGPPRARARPRSHGRWPPGCAGRSSRCSRTSSPTRRMGWRQGCDGCSPVSSIFRRPCCSSTRRRRSPPNGRTRPAWPIG